MFVLVCYSFVYLFLDIRISDEMLKEFSNFLIWTEDDWFSSYDRLSELLFKVNENYLNNSNYYFEESPEFLDNLAKLFNQIHTLFFLVDDDDDVFLPPVTDITSFCIRVSDVSSIIGEKFMANSCFDVIVNYILKSKFLINENLNKEFTNGTSNVKFFNRYHILSDYHFILCNVIFNNRQCKDYLRESDLNNQLLKRISFLENGLAGSEIFKLKTILFTTGLYLTDGEEKFYSNLDKEIVQSMFTALENNAKNDPFRDKLYYKSEEIFTIIKLLAKNDSNIQMLTQILPTLFMFLTEQFSINIQQQALECIHSLSIYPHSRDNILQSGYFQKLQTYYVNSKEIELILHSIIQKFQ